MKVSEQLKPWERTDVDWLKDFRDGIVAMNFESRERIIRILDQRDAEIEMLRKVNLKSRKLKLKDKTCL